MNNVNTDFLLSSNNGTNTLFDSNIYLQVCVYIGFYCCHYHFVFLWFCSHNAVAAQVVSDSRPNEHVLYFFI